MSIPEFSFLPITYISFVMLKWPILRRHEYAPSHPLLTVQPIPVMLSSKSRRFIPVHQGACASCERERNPIPSLCLERRQEFAYPNNIISQAKYQHRAPFIKYSSRSPSTRIRSRVVEVVKANLCFVHSYGPAAYRDPWFIAGLARYAGFMAQCPCDLIRCGPDGPGLYMASMSASLLDVVLLV